MSGFLIASFVMQASSLLFHSMPPTPQTPTPRLVFQGKLWEHVAMRYLGVDYGTKRIGLALAESGGGVVSPLKMIEAKAQMAESARAILKVADEYAAEAVVIGLPLNMDGTEGPQAKLSRTLAAAIQGLSNLPVHLYDERLTSHAADHKLLDRDLTRKQKKTRHDSVAAQILLESFLAREN